jgi:murein L,D-transpeptidase YafK
MGGPQDIRAHWRNARAVAIAVAILALTGGCQGVSSLYGGVQDRLYGEWFGWPQFPAPAVVAPAADPPAVPRNADLVVVFKSQRLLELVHDGRVFEKFPIALGSHPVGPKEERGDGRTPEGRYLIDSRSADTRYALELHISYPNAEDSARAQALHVNPGGDIFIHGLPAGYGLYNPTRWYHDWTEGCIAVGNLAIDKIWSAVPVGTPIDIVP